ncbi:MAG: hypothetical protein F6K21_03990 [Symploca sp. SIO2D2]|nr:hypothetical protein [Symploca sp. SIO2D2]NER22142.1 hypothetical protein [Symploca sp. SIO1C2]
MSLFKSQCITIQVTQPNKSCDRLLDVLEFLLKRSFTTSEAMDALTAFSFVGSMINYQLSIIHW